MKNFSVKSFLMLSGLIVASSAHAAVDSYRFAHVTIATPWYIFLFLLMGVFAPFVLMIILSWRVAMKRSSSGVSDINPSVK